MKKSRRKFIIRNVIRNITNKSYRYFGKYTRLAFSIFLIVFLYLCLMGSYIKESKYNVNQYVLKGTNKSEWKADERLRFTQHIPPMDVLLNQVLIQKHDVLIKDIHILYYEMGLIQTKNETCKTHSEPALGADWCKGIGTTLVMQLQLYRNFIYYANIYVKISDSWYYCCIRSFQKRCSYIFS